MYSFRVTGKITLEKTKKGVRFAPATVAETLTYAEALSVQKSAVASGQWSDLKIIPLAYELGQA